MRVGNHNITQKANGDWTEYRIFGGDRFLYYKQVYGFESSEKDIKILKDKLRAKAKKQKRNIKIRAVKNANGWSIWYRCER